MRFRISRITLLRTPTTRVIIARRKRRCDVSAEWRSGQTNWIDSICYHAMLGEVLYAEGRNADALAEFDQACQVFLAYPNWLLQVKFQSSAGGMRLDPNRSRRVPSWGKSSRTFVIGQFSNSEQVLVGDLNYQTAAQQGGVVRTPMFWRVNVVEVMRMTALAIRRRSELLGPLAPQDAISKELSVVLGARQFGAGKSLDTGLDRCAPRLGTVGDGETRRGGHAAGAVARRRGAI